MNIYFRPNIHQNGPEILGVKSTNGMPSIKMNVWWLWVLLLVDVSITRCEFGEIHMLIMGPEVLFTLKNCNNLNITD
jgi:hypothetical protein